ncbi:MAG: ribonuclease P protein component [Aureliella sp.]|jgi:ribonuclease P protein component
MDSLGNPSSVRGQRFGKSQRLHSRRDFDDLFARGKVVVDQVLVIHARPSPARGRLGISISKRVGHAPFRNRWKRLIREAYRRLAPRLPALQRLDIVVRPRRGAEPSYAAIERSLGSLAGRLDRQLR